jgi:hypothetical protein
MNSERRDFVRAILAGPLVALAVGGLARGPAAQQGQGSAQPQRVPFPQGGDKTFPDDTPKIDPKLLLKHNQQQIHDDVLKLYDLAGQLKEQVIKTDSANVLSMGLIQKAEEVEKLAKQIKTLARGS